MRKLILIITFFSFSAQASWSPYTVKPGDQLGKLVQDLGLKKKLWGNKGLVAEVYDRNQSVIKSPDIIVIGQIIFLPQSLEDLEVSGSKINEYNEEQEPIPMEVKPLAEKEPTTIFEDELSEEIITKEKDIDINKRKATLSLGVTTSLMDRNLTDKTTHASGTAQSEPIYGLFLISQIPIFNLWNIDTSMAYRKINFASSPSRRFAVNSTRFLRFSIGASRDFENINLGAGLIYEQIPIITGVSSTIIGFDGINVLSPYISGNWSFLSWGKMNLGFKFIALYNLSSSGNNITLVKGFDTRLALNLERGISEALTCSLVPFIQFGSKETKTVEHADKEAGVRFLINWKY